MSNTTEVSCSTCGCIFLKKNNEYNRRLRNGYKKFYCGRSCGTVAANKTLPRSGNPANLVNHCNNRLDEFTQFRWFYRVCQKRKKDFNLTLDYLKNLWEESGGICPVSGKYMVLPYDSDGWGKDAGPYCASIDRTDSSKGYIIGNVRYVCRIVNYSKHTYTDAQVIDFCTSVYLYNKDKCG